MPKPGDVFERYTLEALLGQGGMGSVYRAFDPRLGRRVALKVIMGGPGEAADAAATALANERLVREARAAAAFDHPNAVAIFDVGEHEGTPYIAMELVEGRTLRPEPGAAPAPVADRLAQLAGVARALGAAHARGLVHRDVKPENVMVRSDGLVKVLDFGIARRAAGPVDPASATHAPALPTLTVEGVKLGTPVYMAPEQIRGHELDGRTDQFAWGVLAHEVLTGELPWRGGGDVLAVMASVVADPVDGAALARAGIAPAIARVVLRALAKRPDDRFATMDDLRRALEAAERGGGGERPSAPAGATLAQRFSTGEVNAVLSRAIERQAAEQGSTTLGFDDLVAVAAEVGVDVESLREASRELRRRAEPAAPAAPAEAVVVDGNRDAWLRQQRMLFVRHAGIYAIVNVAILVLGLGLLTFTPWWIWFLPALGWGIGVAIHGLVALTTTEQDWLDHQAGMKLWHEDRTHRRERKRRRSSPALPEAPRRRVTEGVRPRVAEDPTTPPEEDQAFEPAPAACRRRR